MAARFAFIARVYLEPLMMNSTKTPLSDMAPEKLIPRKPIDLFIRIGVIGFLVGWALTIGSVYHYPIIVGGKPLISLTPFAVIAYICTILFGALFTVGGMLLNARLPRIQVGRGYDPRLTGNRFGLQVICGQVEVETLKQKMLDHGAEEVKYVEV